MNDAGASPGPPAAAPSGEDALARLMRGEWRDADTGAAITAPALDVVIAGSLAGSEAELVASLALGTRIAVVSDAATDAAMGRRVARALRALGPVTPLSLGDDVHADAATVQRLHAATRDVDALVAVGSGTVNDLCKYAAAQQCKPYAVFATAPSMNGYTSANASITFDGHKRSVPAASARGVFLDLEVLAAAPVRLIRAGLGDSLCRSTAQVDWLLSHCLLGTPYRTTPFALLAADEPMLLDASAELVAGDAAAMRALARTLVLSGIGMTLCGGSHPASQGEHLISHYIDTYAPSSRGACPHGEQVGVATLAMARLQQAMLAGGPPRLRPARIDPAGLASRLGDAMATACWPDVEAKQAAASGDTSADRRIAANWDAWREALRAASIPVARLDEALSRAGAARTPADIGLSAGFFAEAVANARLLRNRYTFLDLADAAGCLDRIARSASG